MEKRTKTYGGVVEYVGPDGIGIRSVDNLLSFIASQDVEKFRVRKAQDKPPSWTGTPKGWDAESLKSYFETTGGSFTSCVEKAGGFTDTPEKFCGSLKSFVKSQGRRKAQFWEGSKIKSKETGEEGEIVSQQTDAQGGTLLTLQFTNGSTAILPEIAVVRSFEIVGKRTAQESAEDYIVGSQVVLSQPWTVYPRRNDEYEDLDTGLGGKITYKGSQGDFYVLWDNGIETQEMADSDTLDAIKLAASKRTAEEPTPKYPTSITDAIDGTDLGDKKYLQIPTSIVQDNLDTENAKLTDRPDVSKDTILDQAIVDKADVGGGESEKVGQAVREYVGLQKRVAFRDGDRVQYDPSLWDKFTSDERLEAGDQGTITTEGSFFGIYADPARKYIGINWDKGFYAGVGKESLTKVGKKAQPEQNEYPPQMQHTSSPERETTECPKCKYRGGEEEFEQGGGEGGGGGNGGGGNGGGEGEKTCPQCGQDMGSEEEFGMGGKKGDNMKGQSKKRQGVDQAQRDYYKREYDSSTVGRDYSTSLTREVKIALDAVREYHKLQQGDNRV